MWLLNVHTAQLEEFFEESIPPYAILSHTWGEKEISFRDITQDPQHTSRAAYHKIHESCRLAKELGLGYVWIDTCCIDKSSSAELSEAINSMFRWYEKSSICLVYLADVPSSNDVYTPNSAFRQSRWHQRGWTLQELLAPEMHTFYGSDWEHILTHKNGMSEPIDKSTYQHSRNLLQEITRIEDLTSWKSAGLANKLSWASKRKTTRKEDIAYCLLGLLNVQMPLLYGEGETAFRRLLLTIMEHDNSHDLLLAGYGLDFKSVLQPDALQTSILPRSPAAYAGCVGIERLRAVFHERAAHYTITNAGLLIDLPLVHFTGQTNFALAILDYAHTRSGDRLTLPLTLCDEPNIYQVDPGLGVIDMPHWMTVQAVVSQIYISTAVDTTLNGLSRNLLTWLNFIEAAKYGFVITSAFPTSRLSRYDAETDVFWFSPREYQVLILALEGTTNRVAVLAKHPSSFAGFNLTLSPEHMCWFHVTKCSSAIEFLLDHTWFEPQLLESSYEYDIRDLSLRGPSVTQPPKREIVWKKQIELTTVAESGSEESEITLRVSYLQGTPGRKIRVESIEPRR